LYRGTKIYARDEKLFFQNAGFLMNIDSTTGKVLKGEMEQCEKTCNEQFMSLIPIDESWLEKDSTIYSVVSE
jgi:hypothetical protein